MPVIEGVGDEVLVVVGLFLLLCIVLLAWFSTHTRDIPFVSVIVVELSQRRHRNASSEENDVQGEEDRAEDQQVETAPSEAGVDVDVDVAAKETAGSNNNADTANSDSGEDSASAAAATTTSKNCTVEGVASQSALDPNTKPPGCPAPVPSGVSESDVTEQAAEGSSLGQAEAEVEVEEVLIPAFRPQNESGEEVRRRRVAYFEGGSGQGGGGAQKDDVAPGTHTAAPTEGSLMKDSAEVAASCETVARKYASCHVIPSSDAQASRLDGRSLPLVSSSPVTASSAPALSSQPPPPAPPPPPSEASSSPLTATSVAEGSPGSVHTGEPSSGATVGSTPWPTGESPSGLSGPEEGGEEGAPASGGVSDRVGGNLAEMSDGAGQQIRVRLKYLNDTQRLVYADPHETVGNFRRLHFSSELEDNKIVRFIFNGQDLRNDLSTLQAYNIADNSVVHCLITQSRQSEAAAAAAGGGASGSNGQEDDPQMGALLFPVFGVVLGLVWYLRFSYKQYFNAMSTVSLAGISFIYVLAFFSSVRHRRRPHQHLE